MPRKKEADFVARDRELVAAETETREAAEATSRALMEHRWRWTLDESNPERLSFAEYADRVGRDETPIRKYARGYEILVQSHGITAAEARERASRAPERTAAAEALTAAYADVNGKASFAHVAHAKRDQVRLVQEIAEERAEENGTTIEEEAPAVARRLLENRRKKDPRKEAREGGLVALMGKCGTATTALREVLRIIRRAEENDPLGEEARRAILVFVGNVRDALALVELTLDAGTEIDWDAELAKLAGEEADR